MPLDDAETECSSDSGAFHRGSVWDTGKAKYTLCIRVIKIYSNAGDLEEHLSCRGQPQKVSR